MTQLQMQRMANFQNASLHTRNRRKEVAAKRPDTERDVFLEIEVENLSTQELQVVLFDVLSAFAEQQNYSPSSNITIRGVSKNYQLILNKLVNGKLIVNDLHLEVNAGKKAQFSRPMDIYDDSTSANNVTLVSTIHPSKGRNSMQENLDLVEIKGVNKIFNSTTALVYNQIGQSTLTLRFFATEIRN